MIQKRTKPARTYDTERMKDKTRRWNDNTKAGGYEWLKNRYLILI